VEPCGEVARAREKACTTRLANGYLGHKREGESFGSIRKDSRRGVGPQRGQVLVLYNGQNKIGRGRERFGTQMPMHGMVVSLLLPNENG
jgi:hypothetical protein